MLSALSVLSLLSLGVVATPPPALDAFRWSASPISR